MTTMHFLVEVEADKTSGVFAPRDELEDRISSALEDAAQSADLSSLGANSDSEYEVSQTGVSVLDAKALKAQRDEYDEHVPAYDLPELAKTARALRAQVADLERQLGEQQRKIEAMEATRTADGGKVYTENWSERVKHYVPDGDKGVRFDVESVRGGVKMRKPDTFTVTIITPRDDEQEYLEVRSDGMGFLMQQTSGNVVLIKPGSIQ